MHTKLQLVIPIAMVNQSLYRIVRILCVHAYRNNMKLYVKTNFSIRLQFIYSLLSGVEAMSFKKIIVILR